MATFAHLFSSWVTAQPYSARTTYGSTWTKPDSLEDRGVDLNELRIVLRRNNPAIALPRTSRIRRIVVEVLARQECRGTKELAVRIATRANAASSRHSCKSQGILSGTQ